MIKIAFIIDTIESPTAGTEKQLLMLIKHLDRKRFRPFLCVLRSSEWLEREFCDGELINIGVSSFANPVSYINIFRFVAFLRREKVDIVQTHFIEGNKVGVMAGKLAGVRAIIATRRNQGYWHNRLEVLMLNILNKWVTCFLANSENTKQWVAKVEGIEPQRIQVIHNGLEIDQFYKGTKAERAFFRKQLGFPDEAIIVGIVANLRPVKAIDQFIKAAKMVSERSSQARFIIIGDGSERASLESLCNDLELTSYVRFLGKRFDIPQVLSCIDIGVLSSKSESFSNAIVEYMAAGLAVVSTDVGGVREAVEDGVNGFVVAPGNFDLLAERLGSILVNNTFCEMGYKGREKALSGFSHMKIFNRYQEFYGEIA